MTYIKGGGGSLKGIRSRVLNGKRTNLADLIAHKVKSSLWLPSLLGKLLKGPRLYAGHTRFATSSKVNVPCRYFLDIHSHPCTPDLISLLSRFVAR